MSAGSPFSAHWHRLRELRVRLADDVEAVGRLYRGRPSHLLRRPSGGTPYRLDSLAYDLIARLDGATTVDALWRETRVRLGDEAPTQPELLRLLGELHEADLLVVDRALDAERLFRRGREAVRRERRQRLASPLYLRFALCDPDAWLERTLPLVRPLFTRAAALVWLALGLAALVRVLPERERLAAELASLSPTPSDVALFVVVYALMKLVHELAHAFAVKRHGGRVRELGVALMVLVPSPYTEAGAATLFPDKRARLEVDAAGIVAELGIAAVAALVWSSTGGLVHEIALAAMLIGGVSTVLFNGNPLMKFDAYHFLADWLEIPNLAERSRRHLLGRAARALLGQRTERPPTDRRERAWLLGYGLASSAYRVALLLGIAWLLSERYFFFGLLLALYVLFTLLVRPLVRLLLFLGRLPPAPRRRGLALGVSSVGALVLFATLVPLPYATLADGVVWLPEEALVRADHGCDVVELLAAPGARVARGAPLLRCEDGELETRRRMAAARLRELEAERQGLATLDPAGHRAMAPALRDAAAELALLDERLAGRLLRSGLDGRFSVERPGLLGRRVAEGEIVAYVVPPRARRVRVALRQHEIERVARSAEPVEVALREHPGPTGRFVSRVVRRTPKPTTAVVSDALTHRGGGRLATIDSAGGTRLAEPVFDVELAWPETAPASRVGGAARVRFAHAAAPLAPRLLDGLRRAFLARARS